MKPHTPICIAVAVLAGGLLVMKSPIQNSGISAQTEQVNASKSTGELLLQTPSTDGVRDLGAAHQPAVESATPCDFFAPWSEVECTMIDAVSLHLTLAGEGVPQEEIDWTCLPGQWLVASLFAHCEGSIDLNEQTIRTISRHLGPRLPDPSALAKTGLLERVAPESLSCFLSYLLPENASQEDLARAWGWGMMAFFSERGDMWKAEPTAVNSLETLMAEWPIGEDSWWEDLWAALPVDSHKESLNVRVTIFETLHGILPKQEWIGRMAQFAGMENYTNVGSHALWQVGNVLSDHVQREDFPYLFGMAETEEWKRALVFGYPDSISWPNDGFVAVDDNIKGMITELREDLDYPYRTELLSRQWALLGPESALHHFEQYVYQTDRSTIQWELEGATHVKALLRSVDSISDADQLEYTKYLIRDLLQFSPPKERARLLDKIKSEHLEPAGKTKMVEILGATWITGLDTEHQDWLNS